MTTPSTMPRSVHDLDALLATPDDASVSALQAVDGDIMILGAGGKMGPTLARMTRLALDAADGGNRSRRRVTAVSRFSDAGAAAVLEAHGVEIIRADLADPAQVRALPVAPNMVWMAGQKFGSTGDPVGTWTSNVLASSYAAEHFSGARIVCFSTGNVYGPTPVAMGGSREGDALVPDGEYAASCIGRERIFEAVSRRVRSPLLLYRLFYACDLRYGVLTDLAVRIRDGAAIPSAPAYVNVIWQGDANRLALRALGLASSPPRALNVTGAMRSVRALAAALGERMGVQPVFDAAPVSPGPRDAAGAADLQADAAETDARGPRADLDARALVANVEALDTLLPHEALPLDTLLDWTAWWVTTGMPLLGKPTRYEVRDGRF